MSKNFTKCPCCDSEIKYEEYNNTHIWICQGETCPFVAFEFIGADDLRSIANRLLDSVVDIKVL